VSLKVLIVDDDVNTLKLVGLLLERRGYQIVAAQSGIQALHKAQTEDIALVLLDIMMPGMDGYEVCRRLRANPATAHLPIILFTARSLEDDHGAGFEAGADEYLTKPIHPADLVSRIEAVLLRVTRRKEGTPTFRRAKVLGFLGAKGGAGTTSLAVNVAVALAQGPAKDKRVVLADVRSGMATLALQLGLTYQGGLAQLLNETADEIQAATVEALLEEHRSGVRVLSGPIEPIGAAVTISPDQAETIVGHLAMMTDYLLLDLGVGVAEVNQRVIHECDHVVVVTEPQRIALTLTQALLGELTTLLKLPRSKISIALIKKAPAARTLSIEIIEGLLQQPLAVAIPPAPELAFQSAETGVAMVTIQPESLAAHQFRALADHLSHVGE